MNSCPVCGTQIKGLRCVVCGYEKQNEPVTDNSHCYSDPACSYEENGQCFTEIDQDEEFDHNMTSASEIRNSVTGTVSSCDGPRFRQPAANYWKTGTVLIWVLLLLPVLVTIKIVSLIVSLAFSIVFRRPFFGTGQRSWLDEILFFRLTEVLFRKKEPVPCYIIKLQTPAGPVIARQEGEFDTTYPMIGHEVELHGVVRNGVLMINSGFDHTAKVQFSRPHSYYKIFFFISLLILVAIVVALMMLGNK